jgi:hypothetical protein
LNDLNVGIKENSMRLKDVASDHSHQRQQKLHYSSANALAPCLQPSAMSDQEAKHLKDEAAGSDCLLRSGDGYMMNKIDSEAVPSMDIRSDFVSQFSGCNADADIFSQEIRGIEEAN